jgi:carbon storage regulator
MLVLSRKLGEAICIGSSIKVSVLGVKGGRVRIGLSAPREVPIHRTEIRREIQGASAARITDESAGSAEIT